jgi:hypothetical protein
MEEGGTKLLILEFVVCKEGYRSIGVKSNSLDTFVKHVFSKF